MAPRDDNQIDEAVYYDDLLAAADLGELSAPPNNRIWSRRNQQASAATIGRDGGAAPALECDADHAVGSGGGQLVTTGLSTIISSA